MDQGKRQGHRFRHPSSSLRLPSGLFRPVDRNRAPPMRQNPIQNSAREQRPVESARAACDSSRLGPSTHPSTCGDVLPHSGDARSAIVRRRMVSIRGVSQEVEVGGRASQTQSYPLAPSRPGKGPERAQRSPIPTPQGMPPQKRSLPMQLLPADSRSSCILPSQRHLPTHTWGTSLRVIGPPGSFSLFRRHLSKFTRKNKVLSSRMAILHAHGPPPSLFRL